MCYKPVNGTCYIIVRLLLEVLAERIAEAQRELALRKQCYPQWIKSGTLDAGDATYQLLVQERLCGR